MPKHVLEKREEVDSKVSAETIVKMANLTQSTESSTDAKQLVVYTGENMIDHVPTEHVLCCGHQVFLIVLSCNGCGCHSNKFYSVSDLMLFVKSNH